jgi:hypothetical protein
MSTIWSEKELEVLSSNLSLEEKVGLLPGRTLRSIKDKSFKEGLPIRKQGSSSRIPHWKKRLGYYRDARSMPLKSVWPS